MKIEKPVTIDLLFKSIGTKSFIIPVDVIILEDDKTGEREVKAKSVVLKEHLFLNDYLVDADLLALSECPNIR